MLPADHPDAQRFQLVRLRTLVARLQVVRRHFRADPAEQLRGGRAAAGQAKHRHLLPAIRFQGSHTVQIPLYQMRPMAASTRPANQNVVTTRHSDQPDSSKW